VGTCQSVLIPLNGLLLVGIGVCETLNGTSVAAEKTMQVGTDFVSLTLTESVALSTSCLKEAGTLLCVSCGKDYRQLKFSVIWKVDWVSGASCRHSRAQEIEV
jgi:hypothetical protein